MALPTSVLPWSRIWAIVQMERRNTRRTARYWVFLLIAWSIGLFGYFWLGTVHALFSAVSPSAGMIGPRYLMAAIGLYYLTGFVLGLVFLGFDVRDRDVRDGIVEVLDARPLTNLELVAGRFIGLFLSAWMPIVILVALIQGVGWILPLLGSPVGRTVEPLSLVYFVVFMAVPAIAFAIALVFVVTLLVRHRLVAAVISIAAIVGLYWMILTVPGPYAPYFDFLGATQQVFASDIAPQLARPGGLLQRVGVLIFAFGLLGLAAALHPRLDRPARLRPAAGSAALLVIGLAGIGFVSEQRAAEVATLERWRGAHAARADEPVADIVSIAGNIVIDPGRDMGADLRIELAAPADAAMSHVLLTLNPGFVIDEVSAADGRPLPATHADGLLDVELDRTLGPGELLSLQLSYSGRPDLSFAYLDSVIVPETMSLGEAQLILLGYQRGLFDRRYVALTPGIRWLPAAGVDVGRDDPRERHADYFTVTLEVEVPPRWLAAAPGRRQQLGSTDASARFRFAPQVPVPEVGLMAGEFTRFAAEIRDISFEVLVHPGHAENFEVLAEARGEVEQWIEERLELAAASGLEYPFDGLTVVEVPNTLRSFEGGWRLDSALAPPGMVLMRETSFPTARFDVDIVALEGNRDYEQDGGAPRIDRDRLVNFFSNDSSGSNLFAGAARSFFSHRTSAFGDEAIALDFVLEELSTLMVAGRRGYFSAHLFTDINQAVQSIADSIQGLGLAGAAVGPRPLRTDVWNTVRDVALSGIDPWADPERTIDLLMLKGGEMAQVIVDSLGSGAVVELLARLLERHDGGTYSFADFIEAGTMVSDDLGPLFDDWIKSAGLPGFVARGVEQYRLPDDASGNARYQLLVRLSNDEPVVGFARVSWRVADAAAAAAALARLPPEFALSPGVTITSLIAGASGPIRIPARSAIEFGALLNQPVLGVIVQPYLSLNRNDFEAGQFDPSSIPERVLEPFDGVRQIPFDFDDGERIIADDLDETFSVVTGDGENLLRLTARFNVPEGLDQGLPVTTGYAPPSQWSRRALPASWGRYRHTMAYIGAGDGRTRAVMPVSIPADGVWRLEMHIPLRNALTPGRGNLITLSGNSAAAVSFAASVFLPFQGGRWHLEIVSENGRESVDFDASVSTLGWNLVGDFRLPAGQVSVEISDQSDGNFVIADAIAWSPVTGETEQHDTESPTVP